MKFKVFEMSARDAKIVSKHPGFYYHARNGSKVNLPSQRFPTLAHAIRAVEQLWFAFAKAQGHPVLIVPSHIKYTHAQAVKRFCEMVPVPWARDSLKPKPKLAPLFKNRT